MRSSYASSAARTSSMWSPPNFSRYADARTIASIASPTTPAAGTTAEARRPRSPPPAPPPGGRHDGGVRALAERLRRLQRVDVHRAQRFGERRQRLGGRPDD